MHAAKLNEPPIAVISYRKEKIMSAALQQRGTLEEKYGRIFDAVLAADNTEERKQLLFALDEIVGERLAHEMEHAQEFRGYDRQFVAS